MTEIAIPRQNDDTRPALLVFTLGPEAERRRRALLPPHAGSLEQAVLGACLSSTLVAGRAAGCRLLVSSPTTLGLPADVEALPQRGQGFGERLRLAVAEARARVGGPILVVPGDVPDLRATHLEAALASLRAEPRRVVLGPDRDGGIYLLGASGEVDGAMGGEIDKLIASTPWRRRGTRHALERACQVAGRAVACLEPLGDLDHRTDLVSWLARARRSSAPSSMWRGLVARLLFWLRTIHQPGPRLTPVPIAQATHAPWSRRGPPRV